MSFDPNFNSGQADSNFMSADSFLDFQGLPDNEDSIDISSLASLSGIEAGEEDDLFKSLFHIYPLDSELKKEDLIGGDKELESCQQYLQSTSTSTCSSAATSPVPFNCFNTPPLTPQRFENKSLLRQHLQFNGKSSNMAQFSLMQDNDIGHQRYEAQRCLNLTQIPNKSNPNSNNGMSSQIKTDPEVLSSIPDYLPVKQESSIQPDTPLALTTDRTKPLSSNLNMANKRQSSNHVIEPRNKKSKTIAKGTPEYIQKRERNNVAVRRSRDKAKRKALETQEKVHSLTEENKMLREQVKSLSHEVNTLKDVLQKISQCPGVKTP